MFLLFQAYGNPAIFKQTLFCLRSLEYWLVNDLPEIKIVIYTDNASFFTTHLPEWKNVFFEPLTPQRLKEWRGPLDFVHRAKICLIQDFFDKYAAPVCYMDSDTLFLSDPRPLFTQIGPKNSLMHIFEETLNEPKALLLRKIGRFVKTQTLTLHGSGFKIPISTQMWNAGVLGLHTSHATLIPDVLVLSDQLHAFYAKHLMEQLAFSYVLQKHTTLHAASPVIFHYWAIKPQLDSQIELYLNGKLPFADFMKNHLPALVQHADALEPKMGFIDKVRWHMKKLFSGQG